MTLFVEPLGGGGGVGWLVVGGGGQKSRLRRLVTTEVCKELPSWLKAWPPASAAGASDAELLLSLRDQSALRLLWRQQHNTISFCPPSLQLYLILSLPMWDSTSTGQDN